MKKLLLVLLTFLICLSVSALPPMPGKVKFTQPDGTTILLEVHGNAHVHWYSDESGRRMEKDKDGFWRPVLWEGNWNNGSSRRNFVSLNDDEDDDYDDDDDEDEDEDEDEGEEEEYEPITTGVRHFPVVLVNFTDPICLTGRGTVTTEPRALSGTTTMRTPAAFLSRFSMSTAL